MTVDIRRVFGVLEFQLGFSHFMLIAARDDGAPVMKTAFNIEQAQFLTEAQTVDRRRLLGVFEFQLGFSHFMLIAVRMTALPQTALP